MISVSEASSRLLPWRRVSPAPGVWPVPGIRPDPGQRSPTPSAGDGVPGHLKLSQPFGAADSLTLSHYQSFARLTQIAVSHRRNRRKVPCNPAFSDCKTRPPFARTERIRGCLQRPFHTSKQASKCWERDLSGPTIQIINHEGHEDHGGGYWHFFVSCAP